MPDPPAAAISLAFEMMDAVAFGASREAWLSVGRRLFTPAFLSLTAGVGILFALAVQRGAALAWMLLFGAGPAWFVLRASVPAGAFSPDGRGGD
jgi:hypothetical protein